MPANFVQTLEAANLFCGGNPVSDGVNPSNHLTLAELKLPGLTEQYTDHRAGGSPVAIEIDTIIQRLESTFMLLGWTPQVATLIKSWSANNNVFHAYGLIRDRQTGDAYQADAEIHGRLGQADPQNFRRGDAQHWTYAIRGITYYNLQVKNPTSGDNTPVYLFDWFNNILQVGGNDVNADLNTALITGSTSATVVPTGP